MLCEQFNDHQCQRGGIRWYIPERDGPPSLPHLASHLGLGHLYRLFPCTADGYRLPQPDNPDILQAQLEAEKARNTPYDHANDRIPRVTDISQELQDLVSDHANDGNNGRNPAHHNMDDDTGYDA